MPTLPIIPECLSLNLLPTNHRLKVFITARVHLGLTQCLVNSQANTHLIFYQSNELRFGLLLIVVHVSPLCSDSVGVPMESEEEKQGAPGPEKEEDVGIVFVARKVETPKQRPKSGESSWKRTWKQYLKKTPMSLSPPLGPAVLNESPRPDPAPLSPPTSDCHLPWKAGMGSPPPCVSVEAIKIIPVDLQRAWNQSISSLESISSPPAPLAPPEPVHPRVGALSKPGGARPASYTPTSSTSFTGAQGSQDTSRFPEKTTKRTEAKEEEEEEEDVKAQEVQPLMPPGSVAPPPLPISAPNSGRLRNPRVYVRSLMTAPPPEHHSRGPTHL